jgi:hypothetical protein
MALFQAALFVSFSLVHRFFPALPLTDMHYNGLFQRIDDVKIGLFMFPNFNP